VSSHSIPTFLPIRICSPRKSSVASPAFLPEIYLDHMLQAFFKTFDTHGFAVLSRKNGICLSSHRTENYGDWEEKDDGQIRAMLKEQAKNPELAGITFIYWNHHPLTRAKWVRMLAEAGFHVIERRTLAEIKAVLAGQSQARSSLDTWMHATRPAVEG
jgi:hypothetical protein